MPSGVSAKASNDFPSRCMWGFTVSREISRSTTVFVVKVFTSFGGMINGGTISEIPSVPNCIS